MSQACLRDRQLVKLTLQTFEKFRVSDFQIQAFKMKALKFLFLRSVAPLMSPGKEEKAKGEEKVILSFIHPLMSEMVISKIDVSYV